jgi:hypothetical protein
VTTSFHAENSSSGRSPAMTPPATRKLGTSSPVPQTLPPSDPRLSYPFCPYKVETDPGRNSGAAC